MKDYYLVSYFGHNPIGAYALVYAESANQALSNFLQTLIVDEPSLYEYNRKMLVAGAVRPVKLNAYGVQIISNGEY